MGKDWKKMRKRGEIMEKEGAKKTSRDKLLLSEGKWEKDVFGKIKRYLRRSGSGGWI